MNVPAKILQKWAILKKHGITKACVYRRMAASVYSTTTHAVTTPTTSSTNVDVLFDKIKKARTMEEPLLTNDRLASFPALYLSFTPAEDDVIVDNMSALWIVRGVAVDPAGALYTLTVRPQ